MRREYLYKEYNLHVTTQVCACLVSTKRKLPAIGHMATVSITENSTGTLVLPPMDVSESDSEWFINEAVALIAAKTVG